ncbi:MAG: flavin-containing monooxygenase [Actinomycetota bacterium]
MQTERFDTVVIGGGQAGLATGYELRKRGIGFVILDAGERLGQAWRDRWDSLRLFTPARAAALPGMRLPVPGDRYVTKDEMADYLEAYAERFALPVRLGAQVARVSKTDDGFEVETTDGRVFEADNVVIATGAHGRPRVPAFASELDPDVVQIHSSAYRNPAQLRPGGVLIVGAGNSGADIAMEVVRSHPTWLAGPSTGSLPFVIDTWVARKIATRIVVGLGRHVVTLRTPIGRRVRAKSQGKGDPLIRVKPKWLAAAGVERVGRVVAVEGGLPVLDDVGMLPVANVIWATGLVQDLTWLEVSAFGAEGGLAHERGVSTTVPGLFFVGLRWQFSIGSDTIPGMPRDARYVVRALALRQRSGEKAARMRSAISGMREREAAPPVA